MTWPEQTKFGTSIPYFSIVDIPEQTMADVTPPGEGPTPLGHGVNKELIGQAIVKYGGYSKNNPLDQLIGSFTGTPKYDVRDYLNELPYSVTTELGSAAVIPADAPGAVVLLSPLPGFPWGSVVTITADGKVIPHGPPSNAQEVVKKKLYSVCFDQDDASLVRDFLNKTGPKPIAVIKNQERHAKLEKLARALQDGLHKQRLAEVEAEQAASPASVPAQMPGRAGRMIELD